jgi:hypothetical protein
MRQFKVYRHPSGALESLRPGWSWRAFFQGCVWAFARKLWWQGAGEVILLLLLFVLTESAGLVVRSALLGLAVVGSHLVFGLRGHAWLAQRLLSRGYRHADTVTANDRSGALALSTRYRGWRSPRALSRP